MDCELRQIAIVGGPRAGKTTWAKHLCGLRPHVRHRCTDELIGLGWSEASEAASGWFDEPGPWVVEGVCVPRALRKWLRRNPQGQPLAQVILIEGAQEELSKGQASMAKGVWTVWEEIRPELEKRGVKIRYHKPEILE